MADPKAAHNKQLRCIHCPLGCLLDVQTNGENLVVTGHQCALGARYARQETQDPRRVVTALVRVAGFEVPLSVKTDRAMPVQLIDPCLKWLGRQRLNGTFQAGDQVFENILGSGVHVVATRALPERPCPGRPGEA